MSHQVQYSLLDRRPENGMAEVCREHNIKLICYGTLAGGFLTDRYLGKSEPGEEFENRSLVKYKLIIDEFGSWRDFQEVIQAASAVAKKHSTSVAVVASRFILEKDQVGAVIIGARNARHLEDNLKVFDLSLDEEDNKLLCAVLGGKKGPKGDTFGLERIKGGPHEVIMKTNLNRSED